MNWKERIKSNKWLYLFHSLFWISYVTFNYFVSILQWGFAEIADSIGKYFLAALVFYTNAFFIFPNFRRRRNWFLLIGSLVLLLVFSFGVKMFLYLVIFPYTSHFPKESPYDLFTSFSFHAWWWYQYTFFGIGYWFAMESIRREREKVKIEKEKFMVEYAFFHAQINPHFLYNSLNSLYSKAINISTRLADGIMSLSEIMRYTVGENRSHDDKILLEDEVNHINSYIDLNQIRYDDKLQVGFGIKGNIEGIRIVPFILSTLVENAFKHGDEALPINISLDMNEQEKKLSFSVFNTKAKILNRYPSTGIGLVNLKRRLEICYPCSHKLYFENQESTFEAFVIIEL